MTLKEANKVKQNVRCLKNVKNFKIECDIVCSFSFLKKKGMTDRNDHVGAAKNFKIIYERGQLFNPLTQDQILGTFFGLVLYTVARA